MSTATCKGCKGTGLAPMVSSSMRCPSCEGRGHVRNVFNDFNDDARTNIRKQLVELQKTIGQAIEDMDK